MALIRCKECGQEISTKAKTCPHCGSPQKRKTSPFTWLVTILIVLWAIAYFSNERTTTSSMSEPSSGPSSKKQALSSINFDFNWGATAGGNIMEANFTIHNKGKRDVKDIEITCTHFAKSGTRIDSNTRTIYEIIKANSKKSFNNFSMGFIHSQAHKSSCGITDLVVM